MRKFSALALVAFCGALGLSLCVSAPEAQARPLYLKEFAGKYEKLADQAKEMKCGVCHPGKNKKMRNDYGKAISAALGKDKKNVKDKEEIHKAFDAAAKAKNAKGETFGSLIEAGKLPGTNEE